MQTKEPSFYDAQYRKQQVIHLKRKAAQLGLQIIENLLQPLKTTNRVSDWSSWREILRKYCHAFTPAVSLLRYNCQLLDSLALRQFRLSTYRTGLSVMAIGVEVMLILTLVGIRYKQLPPTLRSTQVVIEVVISLLLLVAITASFIYVIMGRYATVLERTQEIGIFRFLGASSTYIFNLLFQESLITAIFGTTAGIAMTYGIKWFMNHALASILSGTLTDVTVYEWWPIAGAISLGSELLGAMVPSWKAVNQDVMQVLSHKQTDNN